jgi:hypothetical protein
MLEPPFCAVARRSAGVIWGLHIGLFCALVAASGSRVRFGVDVQEPGLLRTAGSSAGPTGPAGLAAVQAEVLASWASPPVTSVR